MNSNNNRYDNVYGDGTASVSVHMVHLTNTEKHPVGSNLWTKPISLGH